MKIVYLNNVVRLAGNAYQKTHPELYKLMYFEFRKVKSMDWDDFDYYMNEELAKSDSSKRIKRIGKEELYEFRLPPSAKN